MIRKKKKIDKKTIDDHIANSVIRGEREGADDVDYEVDDILRKSNSSISIFYVVMILLFIFIIIWVNKGWIGRVLFPNEIIE